MKNKFIILLLVYSCFTKAQNRYSQIYENQPISTYVPVNFDLIEKALAAKQASYDKNKEYRDALIKWVLNLKTKTTDEYFIKMMDVCYNGLREMEGQDFGILGDELERYQKTILDEIAQCNKRAEIAAANIPKTLWDNGAEAFKNENYEDAIKYFTTLLGNYSPTAGAYSYRAYSYYSIGKYHAAILDWTKYIELEPNKAIAYRMRGNCNSKEKKYMDALADYNVAIEMEPNYAYTYYDRGEVKSALSDEYGAISDFTKAIELKPDFSMAYNDRGWSKFKLKKYSEAILDLNQAIKLDPKNWVAFDSRQELKFELKDYKGCITDCNFALTINPKILNCYFYRGRAYYKQGNKTKACEDWSKAGEFGKAEAYEFISKYCK